VSTVVVWTPPTAKERLAILRRSRTVAMVGASANPSRASNFVATYLLAESNFEIWFVNPTIDSILGHPVYPSLAELPGRPDVVDVFRRPEELMGVADDAIAAGAKTVWLQLGLWDDAVAAHASAAGLDVVMNRCIKIEHARFRGGLHLAGFDTGVLSSRRTRAI
jgi:predicted CoA-binding protein